MFPAIFQYKPLHSSTKQYNGPPERRETSYSLRYDVPFSSRAPSVGFSAAHQARSAAVSRMAATERATRVAVVSPPVATR